MDSECIKEITYLVGNEEVLKGMTSVPVRVCFDMLVVDFFNELSRALLTKTEYRGFPDLLSYGFWVRMANLLTEKERFSGMLRMGKGVAYHIAPSNVPINFMVSLTSGLLAGNACVVRVSDRDFEQVSILTKEINNILTAKQFQELSRYICVIRYPHSREITDALSRMCDIRIIWGGDRTIGEIRQSPLLPRSQEITFSDRHSLAVIDVDAYMSMDDAEAEKVARLFYTDTYYSDQNACSSPRLVVWLCSSNGREVEPDVAEERFWRVLKELVRKEYTLEPVIAVDKLERFSELITDVELVRSTGEIRMVDQDPLCMRIFVEKLTPELMSYKMPGGYYFETVMEDLTDFLPVLGKEAQTVAYLGVDPERIIELVMANGPRGCDRIVPMGHTMDLSFIWDGYDMIGSMSRVVSIAKPNKGGIDQ